MRSVPAETAVVPMSAPSAATCVTLLPRFSRVVIPAETRTLSVSGFESTSLQSVSAAPVM